MSYNLWFNLFFEIFAGTRTLTSSVLGMCGMATIGADSDDSDFQPEHKRMATSELDSDYSDFQPEEHKRSSTGDIKPVLASRISH